MVESRLEIDMRSQPDDVSCGPTCLDAIYRYYGDPVDLARLIEEIPQLEGGGTLAVHLACHALRRGYEATIYTYNLQLFDPTWFRDGADLAQRLSAQMEVKSSPKLHVASRAYLELLAMGGKIRFEDMTTDLVRGYLSKGIPILTGLSATYLYRSAREYGPRGDHDDVRGEPAGHFVVLYGYHRNSRQVLVADPLETNPVSGTNQYSVSLERATAAILLGIVTHDANLLILRPSGGISPARGKQDRLRR